jgi:C4-dicarboxylate-specific signal transduction histidine kinase
MNREFKEKYLLQLGGELGTAFDLGALAPILEKYAGFIGIESCFVVMYADPSMNNARLVVHMKNKRCTDVSRYKEFPARKILPGNLYKNNRHLIIDALHVRDEQIGYIVLNAGEHPGMIYESLRHKFSSAIKGVQMVSTINRYSEGLEKTVEERTKMLTSLNEEMKDEIKKREIAENELLRQKNLESLGLLAGGIAHDFNNILTALSGNVSLLIEDEGTYETRHEVYNTLINAINNARNLTGQLLTFSKGGIPVKKTMHIIPIIEEAAKFLLHGSTVKPEFDFE